MKTSLTLLRIQGLERIILLTVEGGCGIKPSASEGGGEAKLVILMTIKAVRALNRLILLTVEGGWFHQNLLMFLPSVFIPCL